MRRAEPTAESCPSTPQAPSARSSASSTFPGRWAAGWRSWPARSASSRTSRRRSRTHWPPRSGAGSRTRLPNTTARTNMGSPVPANVPGIHHVTCITGDVQKNVDFYVGVLGLRFIKKTVNFDVPDTYHIYFGDYLGTPGSAMTFFGWPHLPWRPAGSGQVTVVSFAVPARSMQFWTGRLRDLNVETSRVTRFGIDTLVLKDSDSIQIELVGEASDERWQPWPDSPVDPHHQIRSFHSVTLCEESDLNTIQFLTDTMGFRNVASEENRTRFETGAGRPSSVLDALDAPGAPLGEEAAGTS